jgi:hypothetical protein
MMAPRKPAPINSLLEKLSAFKMAHQIKDDPYLDGLRDAIETKKNLHIWAELDPLEYLPVPAARIGAARARLVRLVTVIRNVLVFAPVGLTWYAVGEATSAFSRYIEQNGADVVNFLDFWQNGYGILDEKWRIGTVARLDFLMILLVILLTLYVSQAGHKSEMARESEEAVIDRERLALAIEIHAQLHDKRKITNVTMNAAIAGSISRLVSATHNLEDASKVLEKASRKIPKPAASSSFLDSFSFSDDYDTPKKRTTRGA